MTAGTIERPKRGDIIRYVYLFKSEQAQGRDEGVKERYVLVAGVIGNVYRVLAITTKGEKTKGAIKLPDPVASAAGLSNDSSIVVTEFNRFTFPGYDIRPLMDQPGYIHGRLSPRFTEKIIAELKARKATSVDRD
ncbi:hypothetical protein [Croceicoccus mobilis]|uniref:Growth inhibitor PemK n=1 Tax=Croceicoccus mobilis TaxID=1703339 RepID=A0A916Z8Q6_9SPHN|nr:hypothetical protein [Croceicoccus mobilis]GGD81791.1 hypothetical protein GCM10010990_34660 [Croceicoccus mobilis]